MDIPAEHSQLSPAHLEHLLWVRGCDHVALPSPQEPIAGYFHIEGQAANVGRQPQVRELDWQKPLEARGERTEETSR